MPKPAARSTCTISDTCRPHCRRRPIYEELAQTLSAFFASTLKERGINDVSVESQAKTLAAFVTQHGLLQLIDFCLPCFELHHGVGADSARHRRDGDSQQRGIEHEDGGENPVHEFVLHLCVSCW